jgi:excisionase family DNA binding protein
MSEGSLTVAEAAERLGVSRPTVYAWEKAGRLRRRSDGRVSVTEVERLTKDWPAELDTAKAGLMAATYLETWLGTEAAKAREAVVAAARGVATARGANLDAALTELVDAVEAYRALAPLAKVVRGVREGAAELASDAMRHAREAVK